MNTGILGKQFFFIKTPRKKLYYFYCFDTENDKILKLNVEIILFFNVLRQMFYSKNKIHVIGERK